MKGWAETSGEYHQRLTDEGIAAHERRLSDARFQWGDLGESNRPLSPIEQVLREIDRKTALPHAH